MSLTLLLADDHRIFRQGLKALLQQEPDFKLVGEAADGLETIRLAERLEPNVLVLDLMMPKLNGLDVARQVRRRFPATRIVVLSMHSNEAYAVEALRAGVDGYVLKEASAEDLVKAIRAVNEGKRYFSAPLSEPALNDYIRKAEGAPFDPYNTLTDREREVLQLTVEGYSGTEIGKRLFISARTVESHRANMMRKLSVRNQKELIRFATQHGLQPPEPER